VNVPERHVSHDEGGDDSPWEYAMGTISTLEMTQAERRAAASRSKDRVIGFSAPVRPTRARASKRSA
jgi:hypothetical protein